MVTVSVPRDRQAISRDLSHGVHNVTRGPGLGYVLGASFVLTAALCVPWAGLALGALVLTVGAALYGDVIQRTSPGDQQEVVSRWRTILFPRSVAKPVLCLLMAAGTVIPLWVLNVGTRRSPHWTAPTALLAGSAWTLLPILMLAVYGSDRQERLGIRKSLTLLIRHPFTAILAIAIVPATVALTEVGIATFLYFRESLTFFAFDLMPMPARAQVINGFPHFNEIDYRNYPPSAFVSTYFDGLRRGYTLSAAVPTSLSLPTRYGLDTYALQASQRSYFVYRALLTLAVATFLIVGFAVQAMWLGAIAAVDKKRPA